MARPKNSEVLPRVNRWGVFYGYKKDFIITTPEQAANARYDTSSKGWDWTTKQKLGVGKKTNRRL